MKFSWQAVNIEVNEKRMDRGRYVWRNWYPRTTRQIHASDAAYQYLKTEETHAQRIIIFGVEYNRKSRLWRISYGLEFKNQRQLTLDSLYLSPDKVDECTEAYHA